MKKADYQKIGIILMLIGIVLVIVGAVIFVTTGVDLYKDAGTLQNVASSIVLIVIGIISGGIGAAIYSRAR